MKLKIPHTFTIVFLIIVVCAMMTWFIPGGEFSRQVISVDGNERNVVVPDSFHTTENVPQTWQVFTAFFKGFEKTSYIIAFILMIGGAFWVVSHTKAIEVGIASFLRSTHRLQKLKWLNWLNVDFCIIALIMLMFSVFGAVFGMSEETIAFVVIFVPLAVSMGYDSIVGVLMCNVAAHVGFAGAIFNPFTIGIAQGLSGLAPFSGMGYRFLCWAFLTLLAIVFTLCYASRIKKNPQKSPMYELDAYWRERVAAQDQQIEVEPSSVSTWITYFLISVVLIYCAFRFPFSSISVGNSSKLLVLMPVVAALFVLTGFFSARKSVHSYILNILFFTILILIIGVLCYQWYVMEIAGLFFAMGFVIGFAYHLKLDGIVRLFLDGFKDIMSAAIIVGLAGGIIVILEDGKVIDPILYFVSHGMVNSCKEVAVGAMYLVQNVLNIFIPSGSAKAALTIPMMTEFSDIIGVSRQLTVLAFQFGDGFTNMITPTSGVLIGCLGVARIPYGKWAKFIAPCIIFLIIIGFLLLLPPLYYSFTGF